MCLQFIHFGSETKNIPVFRLEKLYSTPHDMVHVPNKFRENTAMRVPVTDKQTDRRTAFQYLPCRAFCAAGDEYAR